MDMHGAFGRDDGSMVSELMSGTYHTGVAGKNSVGLSFYTTNYALLLRNLFFPLL